MPEETELAATAMRRKAKARWGNMIQRCTNPAHKNYPHYGGRGIRVCARWRSFAAFYADVGDAPPGMWLDRIDNDGNYEPGNVRWATPKQQNANRREYTHPQSMKTHCPAQHAYDAENTYLYNGERHCRECSRQSVRRSRAAA